MKKILSALVLLSFLAVLAVPAMVSANGPATECTLAHDITDVDSACVKSATVNETATAFWGMCCLLDAIYTVTDWIFIILMSVVGIMVLFGAFTLLTAAGAPEKVSSGRNYIIYAMVGMVVALLAKAIPAIVRAVMGL
jgi:hypothetical protein